MAEFDVAAGIYESALNAMLPQVYHALYPDFLKDNIKVNEVGISSVDFDIQAPPTVSMVPSEDAKSHIVAALETLYSAQQAKEGAKALTIADKSAVRAMASSATFSANVPKIALTINYENGSAPTKIQSASLVAHATISVEDDDLTVKILSANINIPNNSTLTQLLNNALVPLLIVYLNKNILSPIKIPHLGYKSLQLSAPLPVVQQSYFTAFSSLGSTPPAIPDPLPWPKEGVYIAVDIPTLEAAAGLFFPLGPQENFNWDIFSGHVGATVNLPTISSINDDGSISASIQANASCQLTIHTPSPLPNISIGPSATATLAVTLYPSIEDGELKVAITNIPTFSFSFDWGIPSWIGWLFYPLEAGLAAALNAVLGPLISDALKNLGITILQIPVIRIDFGGGKTITIAIDQAKPSELQGLLVVAAQATVSPGQP